MDSNRTPVVSEPLMVIGKPDGGKIILVSKKLLLRYQVKQAGRISGIAQIVQKSLQKRKSMVVGK